MNQFIKKVKFTVFLPAILSLLVACSDKPAETTTQSETVPAPTNTATATNEQASVPSTESYIVGVDANYPPYDFKDERGIPQGFDVDIIRAIAQNQALKINIIPQDWEVLVEGVDNAQSHLAMSGFYKSEERMEKYLVSDTYAWGRDAIGVRSDDISTKTLQDLSGKKVATLADSPYIEQLEAVMGKGSPNIVARPSGFLAFKELAQGGAEAVLGEYGVLRYYAKQFPNVNFKITGEGEDFEPYEIAIIAPKSQTELMTKINAGLANIVADGTYAKIYEKWFGVAPERLPTVQQ